MNIKTLGLLVVGLLAGPIAAVGQVVTYDFTGVVTSSNDSAAPVGAAVSGDYTFNLSLFANFYSRQPNGSWSEFNPGLEGQGVQAAEAHNIFTTQVTAGSLSYASAEPTGLEPVGYELMGEAGGSPGHFGANETVDIAYACNGTCTHQMTSSMSIADPDGQISYTAAGLLPMLLPDSIATGAFTNIFGDTVDYRITSLVAAPELDSSHIEAALTLLIGSVLVLKGRRRPTSEVF